MQMKKKRLIYCLGAAAAFLLLSIVVQISIHNEAIAGEKTRFYLVGVGPGDPDLITLRGLEVIKEADLIIIDIGHCNVKGLKEEFASYFKEKEVYETPALWRCYGKNPSEFEGEERLKCEETSRKRNKLIAKVRLTINQGKTVALLDNGDPLIYGPWAWCLEEFEDINPVVVPGLSSFNAANAALKKEVTSGQHTKSVILTSCYSPEGLDSIEKLSAHQATMVIFMGQDLKDLISRLAINYPPKTPVAIVSYAGYAEKERVVRGTLKTILDQTRNEKIGLCLIYVGDFLTYRQKNG